MASFTFKAALLPGVMVGVCLWITGCSESNDQAPQGQSTSAASDKDWSDHTQGLPFIVGYEAGQAKAASNGKPVMYFVTTTWCGYCKQLAEESFNDAEVRELLGQFNCVIVDGDVESTDGYAGFQGFPYIAFRSADGEDLASVSGYVPLKQFKAKAQAALNAANKS
jgi:thioredoxin-related protein